MTAPRAGGRERANRVGPEADVVICTALGSETAAVQEHLRGPFTDHEARGALFEIGTFPGEHGTWRVAHLETGAGGTAAASLVERAVAEFSPGHLFFVGIAGGLKDVRLGDVVAADVIHEYERGKDTEDGFRSRSITHLSSFALVQRARRVANRAEWRRRLTQALPDGRGPEALVAHIAAGEKVLASQRGPVAALLRERCGSAVAVEMEGHGFLQAAHINHQVHALVVRGVSDLLDDKGDENDEVWQPAAARTAAAFAFEVLSRLEPPSRGSSGRGRAGTRARPRRDTGGLGAYVGELRRSRPSGGQATIGFGPEHTVTVIGGDGTVERWDLATAQALPGVPGGAELRPGHQALVSPYRHSAAVARGTRLELVHFEGTSGRHRRVVEPLRSDEHLVTSGGEVLATHDRRRLAVRSFEDGRVLREVACPAGLAASAISLDAGVVALATTNRVHLHLGSAEPVVLDVRNRLEILKPGCWLGVSPSGAFVACASFRELKVWRTEDRTVVTHREFSHQEAVDGLGAHGMRLLCTDEGEVLWLRRGLLSRVTGHPEILHLEQTGRYEDLAIHHDGQLLAAVTRAGLVRTWQWDG